MRPLPQLSFMPRVWSDIETCVAFIARQPWGAPSEREQEIHAAFETICYTPLARPVSGRVPETGVELRRYPVRQFDIVYAYFAPTEECPQGHVSIRAVRHRRERNVLQGVKETGTPLSWSPFQTRDVSAETPRVPALEAHHT
jgi:hypothetical protein